MFNFRFASSLSLPLPTSRLQTSSNQGAVNESTSPFRYSPDTPRTHDLDLETTLYVYRSSWATLNFDPLTFLPRDLSLLQSSRSCRSSDIIHPFISFGKEVYIEEELKWFSVTNIYSTPNSSAQDSYRVWLTAYDKLVYTHLVLDVPGRWVVMTGIQLPDPSYYRPANPGPADLSTSHFHTPSLSPMTPTSPDVDRLSPHPLRSLRRVCSSIIGRL